MVPTVVNGGTMKVLLNLPGKRRARSQLGLARIGTALAATSMGALAVGAVAVGALAIGAIAVKIARIRWLEIDELIIGGQPFRVGG